MTPRATPTAPSEGTAFAVVTAAAVDVLDRNSEVWVFGVPLDQLAQLRAALRSAARRNGWRFVSRVTGDNSLVVITPGRQSKDEMADVALRKMADWEAGVAGRREDRTRFDWAELASGAASLPH